MKLLETLLAFAVLGFGTPSGAAERPNIVVIFADDLGVGDVKVLGGETSQIATPHMDQLAEKGMRFLDAHSSSSVCTPSRYSLMTGRYSWRSPKKAGVLDGYSPPLIEPDRPTVARLLEAEGYATACIGKWHLGMTMPTTDRARPSDAEPEGDRGKPLSPRATNVDWRGRIAGGPNASGFGRYFGISASLDMPPYIWIEDGRFVGECTVTKAFHRPGPAHVDFEAVDVLGTITQKAVAFIRANRDKPMFLYVPLTSPHTPIVPSNEWRGKSGLGAYGDFVMETDHAVGEIVKAIDDAGLAKNTLIILTADNGCSPAARGGMETIVFNGAEPQPVQPGMHYPSGIYRGHKADLFEGGHRVPFIARWSGTVPAGTTCAETICQVDLYATCADLLGKELADAEAPDSVSLRPALLGEVRGPLREATVHHSVNGDFAIRKGRWKLLMCPDSGGWSEPTPKTAARLKLPAVQLYDLSVDPGETVNRQADHPEIVAELEAILTRYVEDGRSTPGAKQSNDGPKHWKQLRWIE